MQQSLLNPHSLTRNSMKKSLVTIIFATAFAAHAQTSKPNLMDLKIDELSYEQKKSIYGKMSQQEMDAVDGFWATQGYRAKHHNVKINELSFNQIINIIKKEHEDARVALNKR
ncbi:hypothetical protein [Comamonas jiangduensis]|uniref:hypothetical protein n=2 Tax=Comamonas jiangduensis TaxID=1194168 RepID=UPI003BF843DF